MAGTEEKRDKKTGRYVKGHCGGPGWTSLKSNRAVRKAVEKLKIAFADQIMESIDLKRHENAMAYMILHAGENKFSQGMGFMQLLKFLDQLGILDRMFVEASDDGSAPISTRAGLIAPGSQIAVREIAGIDVDIVCGRKKDTNQSSSSASAKTPAANDA